MPEEVSVFVAGASGAWGDSSLSTRQLLDDGRADYLVYDGLAEITMAILSRAKAADGQRGYATDIIETVAQNSVEMRARGVKAGHQRRWSQPPGRGRGHLLAGS